MNVISTWNTNARFYIHHYVLTTSEHWGPKMKAGVKGGIFCLQKDCKIVSSRSWNLFILPLHISKYFSTFIFIFKIFTGLEKGHHLPLELEREVHMKSTYLWVKKVYNAILRKMMLNSSQILPFFPIKIDVKLPY